MLAILIAVVLSSLLLILHTYQVNTNISKFAYINKTYVGNLYFKTVYASDHTTYFTITEVDPVFYSLLQFPYSSTPDIMYLAMQFT